MEESDKQPDNLTKRSNTTRKTDSSTDTEDLLVPDMQTHFMKDHGVDATSQTANIRTADMITIPDLIRKKRDGGQLSDDEIKAFIQAVKEKTIQDSQTGAMLMAIWLNGMVSAEIKALTREMMSSGEVMEWPDEWKNFMVDKHSTGGVGDKVSLVLAPALAACGCKVPMISGRGLAHTGGTLDKLESIPGFKVEQSREQVEAGNGLGIRTAAVLSGMNSTIGQCVGNSVEVIESLETLKGNGPDDLMELVTTQGGLLLVMTGLVSDLSEGRKQISEAVVGGAALSKFQAMMEAQGVNSDTAQRLCSTNADYYSVLRKAKHQLELKAPADGIILEIDGLVLAQVLHRLGAGRSKAGEPVNHSVGAVLLVSIGQRVTKGDPWLRLHYEDLALTPDQRNHLESALTVGADKKIQTQQKRTLVEKILPEKYQ
ncbi:thymidine phosphorylase isoform X4 [Simochromis diagramma]|uniref:thymidine phosphorylase isoform X4 n=1 Tax=Simochromis diagramma TaxID=43689 RepID=UPI001A7E65A6|nr:thymidine phosphorylase isoform X4 [Simochromis diagramma]